MFKEKHRKLIVGMLWLLVAAGFLKALTHSLVREEEDAASRKKTAIADKEANRKAEELAASARMCRVGARIYVETRPVDDARLSRFPSHSAVVAEWPYGNATSLVGHEGDGANCCAIWPGTLVEVISAGEDKCGLRVIKGIRDGEVYADCHVGQEWVEPRQTVSAWSRNSQGSANAEHDAQLQQEIRKLVSP